MYTKNIQISGKVVTSLVIITLAVLYHTLFRYHFWFKEQSSIFLFTSDFFTTRISLPGGVSTYIGALFTQFYEIPVIGSTIHSTLFVLLWIVCRKILYGFHGKNFPIFAAMPVIYLAYLFSQVNYGLSLVCAHFLVCSAVLLYVNINTHYRRYLFGFISLILLYMTSNTVFWMASASYIMFEILCRRNKYYLFICISYLLLSGIIPVFAQYYTSFPKNECYFSGHWIMEALITAKDVMLIYPSVGILPVILLIAWFCTTLLGKTGFVYRYGIRFLFFAGCVVLFLASAYRTNEKKYLKSLKLMREEKWDKIVESVEKSTGKAIFPEMFAYNFALARDTSFPKGLLLQNNNTADYYKAELIKGILEKCFISEAYFHLGLTNIAFYTYFNISKALDDYGSAFCLSRMAYIAIIKGDYLLAEKYYGILAKTLLYSREAAHYLQLLSSPDSIDNDPGICKQRSYLVRDDFFWETHFLSNINKYAEYDILNRSADEYLLGFALLSGEPAYLAPLLKKVVSQYYTSSDIPDIYRQALLYSFAGKADKEINRFVQEKDIKLYESFRKDASSGVSKSILEKKYGDSYFYYLMLLKIMHK